MNEETVTLETCDVCNTMRQFVFHCRLCNRVICFFCIKSFCINGSCGSCHYIAKVPNK